MIFGSYNWSRVNCCFKIWYKHTVQLNDLKLLSKFHVARLNRSWVISKSLKQLRTRWLENGGKKAIRGASVGGRGGVHKDVLEDTFWSPWPRSLRSSKIALTSAREQILNHWNFVGKSQKPRGKFAKTFFVFRNWSTGLAKRASPPPNWNFINDKNVTKKPIVSSVSVLFSIFRLQQ